MRQGGERGGVLESDLKGSTSSADPSMGPNLKVFKKSTVGEIKNTGYSEINLVLEKPGRPQKQLPTFPTITNKLLRTLLGQNAEESY